LGTTTRSVDTPKGLVREPGDTAEPKTVEIIPIKSETRLNRPKNGPHSEKKSVRRKKRDGKGRGGKAFKGPNVFSATKEAVQDIGETNNAVGTKVGIEEGKETGERGRLTRRMSKSGTEDM